jgi:hypothetical protein
MIFCILVKILHFGNYYKFICRTIYECEKCEQYKYLNEEMVKQTLLTQYICYRSLNYLLNYIQSITTLE